ncbi:hypothetical protein IHQ56_10670 [Methylobacillus flagellatus]|uniref:hypothetical protein n=1 Tax=Methylobacillus flagellatus TaxID=405 RepID=UPI002853E11A|nr:hypothetical protein [Methylobacillus flagellatus]MDR5172282.1 hypothetical protein [Methylobacillus flagellatus]
MLRRVYVIQYRRTGEFLTQGLFYTRSLKKAGRLYDPQEAIDTAINNIDEGDYEIHSFFEGEEDAPHH